MKVKFILMVMECNVKKVEKKLVKTNEIKVDFNFKNPISPYEVLESPDSRKLGILIKSIKISPI